MNAIAFVHEQLTTIPTVPTFKAGDNITVNYKIVEGTKERIQSFKGDVIKRQGTGATASFTVRKISDGVGVERLFPVFSPNIESITVNKVGRVKEVVRVHVSRKKEWQWLKKDNYNFCIRAENIVLRFFYGVKRGVDSEGVLLTQ